MHPGGVRGAGHRHRCGHRRHRARRTVLPVGRALYRMGPDRRPLRPGRCVRGTSAAGPVRSGGPCPAGPTGPCPPSRTAIRSSGWGTYPLVSTVRLPRLPYRARRPPGTGPAPRAATMASSPARTEPAPVRRATSRAMGPTRVAPRWSGSLQAAFTQLRTGRPGRRAHCRPAPAAPWQHAPCVRRLDDRMYGRGATVSALERRTRRPFRATPRGCPAPSASPPAPHPGHRAGSCPTAPARSAPSANLPPRRGGCRCPAGRPPTGSPRPHTAQRPRRGRRTPGPAWTPPSRPTWR